NLAATPLGLPSERAINFCVASKGPDSVNFCVASNGAASITLAGSSRGALADTASGDGRKTTPIDSGAFLSAGESNTGNDCMFLPPEGMQGVGDGLAGKLGCTYLPPEIITSGGALAEDAGAKLTTFS